eukprot:GHUV01015752.1.p1 GENE.GHUV01015752.1~~GHUV01015752.1.p1  ORF type:complete len:237 (+),score=67.54 GHUV01015752.1:148-858(+)
MLGSSAILLSYVCWDPRQRQLQHIRIVDHCHADVLLKQAEEGPWEFNDKQLQENLLVVRDADHSVIQSVLAAAAERQPGQQALETKRRRRKVHSAAAVEVFDHVLDSGECGLVLLGRAYGVPVALKSADMYQQKEYAMSLKNEVDIFDHLTPLQGKFVARLVAAGVIEGYDVYFIATEVAAGEHPSSSTSAALPVAKQVSNLHAIRVYQTVSSQVRQMSQNPGTLTHQRILQCMGI